MPENFDPCIYKTAEEEREEVPEDRYVSPQYQGPVVLIWNSGEKKEWYEVAFESEEEGDIELTLGTDGWYH
jgi:hypothetical protein